MAITLGTLTLPDDLIWTDEFTWSAIAQKLDYTVTGALMVQEATKLAGRTITLEGSAESGWITRADLNTLRGLAETQATYTLTLHDGRTFTVRFARPALKAAPVITYSAPADTDVYSVTLYLIQVA